jgi:outer membrane protein OmpA-like peptidoglycan-associated protein
MTTLPWSAKQGVCGNGKARAILGVNLAALMAGVALLGLTPPAAHAQTGSEAIAQPQMQSPGHFLVSFALNQVALTDDNRRVIAAAADAYRRGGAPRVSVTGHTDTYGSAAYNLKLSQRRTDAVAGQLVRDGVPASIIVTTGRGETDLLVPTADGVREPRNRRVEIVVPQAPPPVAAAPATEAPAPAAGPTEQAKGTPSRLFTVGPIYGHNFGESRDTVNDLVGAELIYSVFTGPVHGASLKQDILYSLNGDHDGVNGRSIISVDVAPDLGIARPFFSANFGGVYGPGVQNGFVVGPEVGLNLNLFKSVAMRAKVAYDYQFRNGDRLGDGILWTGLGFGVAF